MVTFEEFKKCEIKIGKIISVERVPDTDKLLKLSMDVGEETFRTVISGIAAYFPDPEILVGKFVPIVTNLEPRVIRGIESKGMILSCSGEDGFVLLAPEKEVQPGTEVR